MPALVRDSGLSLLTAGVLAIIFTKLKIPSIAAFLVAGIVIGPIGLKQVTDPVNIDTIAQLGFILLLFLIGLELDFKKILNSGKAIIISGLLQYPLTILFGIVAVKLMIWLGIGGSLLASSEYAAIYIGVIIAGSSTLLVVKLFQEHFELDTEPGRLALGMLIFQDIWVIVAILIQPNIENRASFGKIYDSLEASFPGGVINLIVKHPNPGLGDRSQLINAKKQRLLVWTDPGRSNG